MNKLVLFFATCFLFLMVSAVIAEELPPLKPNEAIAIAPDGHMARVIVTDPKKLGQVMKVATPVPWCKMLLMVSSGRVLLVNTDGHNPMVIREEMVPQAQ